MASGVVPDTKPLLRGWLHLICAFLAVPAAVWVVSVADGGRARVGAAIYAVGLVALFTVSASYHRGPWRPVWKSRMQRLDHTTIFVMIAGSYTPLCLVAMDGWAATAMLVLAWTGAVGGAVLAWLAGRRWARVRFALYLVLGWAAIFAAPELVTSLDVRELVLIAVGGVLFTVGAITLGTRWPDPFPRVFGYHEVWHLLVVAAVVCQLLAIGSAVQGAA